MRKRDQTGLAMAPIFLRLALALTFTWAGLGKFLDRFEVQGQQAAILANYGVIPNPHAPATPHRDTPPADETPAPADKTPQSDLLPDTPASPPASPEGAPSDTPSTLPDEQASLPVPGYRLTSWQSDEQPAQPKFLATATDFPDAVEVRGYAGLVLLLHSAIHPGLDPEDSSPRMQLWPDFDPDTEYDPWPRYAALTAGLTELIAGILLAIGLLTRLSALSLAGVMLTAIWLTVIGPAIQSGDTLLGFLPKHDIFDTNAWAKPLWQLSLLCSAMALVFIGPGTLSLDRLLLGGTKNPPPKPQEKKKA